LSIHFGTTERLERHEIGADIHPSLSGVSSTRGALGWRGKAAADFAAEAEHFSDVHGEFIHVRKEGWQDWAIPTVLLIGEQCENMAPWRRGEGVPDNTAPVLRGTGRDRRGDPSGAASMSTCCMVGPCVLPVMCGRFVQSSFRHHPARRLSVIGTSVTPRLI
jgi:hypothetical protein